MERVIVALTIRIALAARTAQRVKRIFALLGTGGRVPTFILPCVFVWSRRAPPLALLFEYRKLAFTTVQFEIPFGLIAKFDVDGK